MRTFANKTRVGYGKVLEKSSVDKFFDEKQGLELKKINDYYLNNRKNTMKAKKLSVEDIFGNMLENVINEQLQI